MTPDYLRSAPSPCQRPAEVLRVLVGQLSRRGIGPLYGFACDRFGVLSLPAVSVWTNGRVLWWRAGNGGTTWPPYSPTR